MNIIKKTSLCRCFLAQKELLAKTIPLTNLPMLEGLMKRWKVSKKDLILILCVFAMTGTSTAYVSKLITGWVGFTEETFWPWKVLLRVGVLIFGYQVILLIVAFLFGQFPFFWRYEKKILQRMKLIKKEEGVLPAKKEMAP